MAATAAIVADEVRATRVAVLLKQWNEATTAREKRALRTKLKARIERVYAAPAFCAIHRGWVHEVVGKVCSPHLQGMAWPERYAAYCAHLQKWLPLARQRCARCKK